MSSWIVAAVAVAAFAALLTVVAKLRRRRADAEARALAELDTVMAWTPQATRVMTQHERQAYQTLVRALPDHIVLAQVSLARFLKVPTRRSYGEWLSRVGKLNADLLVCDRASEVLAVVEVHSPSDSRRSRKRHERMARVLKAAGIRVIVWMEAAIPGPETARLQVLPQPTVPQEPASEPDSDAQPMRDPAPSTWFDDFDSTPAPLDRGKDKAP